MFRNLFKKTVFLQLSFSLIFMFAVTVEVATAQTNGRATNLPCNTVKDTPAYLKLFVKWADQGTAKRVFVKNRGLSDSVLVIIRFKSFRLKALNQFSDHKKQRKVTGHINGYLKIIGPCKMPQITGDITLYKGFTELTNFGRGSLHSVVVDTVTFFDSVNNIKTLQLNIGIHVGKDYYILNKQYLPLKATLSGVLGLTKKAGEPLQLKGRIEVIGGYTKPLGKRFRLTEGTLTYTGELDNPNVYLRSEYEPHRAKQDVKIWYIVGGTIQDPTFKFKSEPYMEPKNMISYTLFGQPFYQLDSIEQNLVSSVANHSVADHTTEVLLNRAEAIATQKLSVDVVRIDNTNAQSGTVITTGWYINPRVFFAIQNIIAGRPRLGFYLEYYLTEDLKLILSQNDDHGQGVDLQYEYDY